MKNLFYLSICVGLLFAQPSFEGLESEVNSAEISVENLDKTDMKAVSKKETELLYLREKLKNVKAKLDKENVLDSLKMNSFRVKLEAALNEKNLKKEVTSKAFRQGDILEFSSMIRYPKLEEKATTTIQWQLFDKNGNAIENYFKEKDFDFINTSKTHKFKIRLGQNLKMGKYKVALTHFLKQNDKISYQAVKSFEIKQDIHITSLQLFNSPTDTKNRKKFYNDENPHMYVNFKLDKTVEQVKVLLYAINQHGVELYADESERKRKGNSQRAGIKISQLKVGDIVTFTALLTADDGYTIERSKNFMVVNYPLGIDADFNNIEYNGKRRFSLKVPKVFEKPYKINIVHSKLYYTSINNSTLRGTLVARNHEEYDRNDYMKIIVVDSAGRQAVDVHSMSINAKPKKEEKVVKKVVKEIVKKDDIQKPIITFETPKIKIKPKPKPKVVPSVKKGLSRSEKIALGEKRYTKLINDFADNALPICVSKLAKKALISGLKDSAKIDYANQLSKSDIKEFERGEINKIVDALLSGIIKENNYSECYIQILANFYKLYPRNVVYQDKVISIDELAFELYWTEPGVKNSKKSILAQECFPGRKYIRKQFNLDGCK